MTWLDCAFVALVGLSGLLGIWRGLVRELCALAGWIAALAAAAVFAPELARFIPADLATPALRLIAAAVAIFLVVLVAAGVAGLLLAKLLQAAGLGLADRTLGGSFGLARGVLVCLLVVLGAGLTKLPREPFWRESALAPPLETAVIAAKPWLPEAIARRVKYDR